MRNVSKVFHPESNFSASGPLEFLNTWTYELAGGAERGSAQQLFDSVCTTTTSTVRCTTPTTRPSRWFAPRVSSVSSIPPLLDAGLLRWDAPSKIRSRIITERRVNDTLASYDTCNNSNTITVGDTYLRPIWDAIYLPTPTQRLQQYVSGLTLTHEMCTACRVCVPTKRLRWATRTSAASLRRRSGKASSMTWTSSSRAITVS